MLASTVRAKKTKEWIHGRASQQYDRAVQIRSSESDVQRRNVMWQIADWNLTCKDKRDLAVNTRKNYKQNHECESPSRE